MVRTKNNANISVLYSFVQCVSYVIILIIPKNAL